MSDTDTGILEEVMAKAEAAGNPGEESLMRKACEQAVKVTEADGYEAEKVVIVTIDKAGNIGVLPTGFDDVLEILGMLQLSLHSFISNHTG